MVNTSRPRTPSGGTISPPTERLASITEGTDGRPEQQPRRSSFGNLLRRTKSGDLGAKGSKKYQAAMRQQEILREQREAANAPPPRLPDLYNGTALPKLQTFGGEDRPDSVAIMSGRTGNYSQPRHPAEVPRTMSTNTQNIPVPPIPANIYGATKKSENFDPYARTESMTHRGRYSYASSAVSVGGSSISNPRRVRRRKDPTPFNILILGSRGSGKTSFLNFLRTSLALPPKKKANGSVLPEDIFAGEGKRRGNFTSYFLETEIDGERIGLTIWDSEGLEKNLVDLQLREVSAFLESKFEDTFTEEMKVVRAPGVQDTHIHCTFMILDPIRLDGNIAAAAKSYSKSNGINGGLQPIVKGVSALDDEFDLQVMRALQGKTTVVPVISKADTITTAHMAYLKRTVAATLKQANLDPLDVLGLDEDAIESSDEDDNENAIAEEDEDSDASAPKAKTNPSSDSDPPLPIQSTEPGSKSNSPRQYALSSSNSSPRPSPRSNKSSSRLSVASFRQLSNRVSSETNSPVDEIPFLPMSIISPDIYEPTVIGRKFPWGFADPMNEEHCDFLRLKEAVFSEWRGELRELSRDGWYETWRSERLGDRRGR